MDESALQRISRSILVFLTLVIAGLSIMAYFGSYSGKHFQIFAFYGIFQPLLLISNFIFLVFWILKWRIWAIFPLLALVTNVEYISSVYQFRNKCTYELSNDEIPFKICTYNVKGFTHGQRSLTVEMISEFLEENNVDIFCLQEVSFDSINTAESLAKDFYHLPYKSVIEGDIQGFSLAILSKYPILNSARLRFENSGNQAMWADLLINRDTIRIFNFHLQTTNINQTKFPLVPEHWLWDLTGEAEKTMSVYESIQYNSRKRTIQADFIHSKIVSSPFPALVCGDMNSNPASYSYHQVRGHLKDGFITCGKGYEYTFKDLFKLYRLDYIFHSKKFVGLNYQSYLLDFSDHKPVIMELALKHF
jgi:endonuclease/exonuclease/phosphatase family metal-dependent hydrolase